MITPFVVVILRFQLSDQVIGHNVGLVVLLFVVSLVGGEMFIELIRASNQVAGIAWQKSV